MTVPEEFGGTGMKLDEVARVARRLACWAPAAALSLSGGLGMLRESEMERLFRDGRAGRFHPGNASLTHDMVGKMVLGIDPDEVPRWG